MRSSARQREERCRRDTEVIFDLRFAICKLRFECSRDIFPSRLFFAQMRLAGGYNLQRAPNWIGGEGIVFVILGKTGGAT